MLYIIYRIWVETADGKILSYYGHTEDFEKRKKLHMFDHRCWVEAGRPDKISVIHSATRSVLVLDHEGWTMEEVDTIECDKEEDASKLEGKYILENECVNRCVAGRTRKQYYQDNRKKQCEQKKQYYKDNREERREYCKNYYETHKEEQSEYMKKYREENNAKISEQKKQHYNENNAKILEQKKQYYEQNKAIISAKRSQKVTCEICGSVLTKYRISTHKKTKKCLAAKLSKQNTNADALPSSP